MEQHPIIVTLLQLSVIGIMTAILQYHLTKSHVFLRLIVGLFLIAGITILITTYNPILDLIQLFLTAAFIPLSILGLIALLFRRTSLAGFFLLFSVIVVFVTITSLFNSHWQQEGSIAYCTTLSPLLEDYRTREGSYPSTLADLELKTWRKPLAILLHGEDDGCSYHVGEDYYSFYINATILEGWRFDSRSQNWEYLDW